MTASQTAQIEPMIVRVPGGWFWMGCEIGRDDERPVHRVWVDSFGQNPKSLQTHPEVKITKNDGKNGRIEIRKDKQVASFQISPLGDKLTQLVVASNVSQGEEASPTSMVVDAVLRVCKEVDVKCTAEPN